MKNIEELRNAKKDEAGNYIEEFNNLDIRNDENIQISEDTKEDEDIIDVNKAKDSTSILENREEDKKMLNYLEMKV